MSERTPSAHSMTVETERENLAARLFDVERDLVEARRTVIRLEAENAELMKSHAAVTKEWDRDSDVAGRRFDVMKAVVEAVINAI